MTEELSNTHPVHERETIDKKHDSGGKTETVDVEAVSRDLFGRSCRLPLALWILERDKRFYQSEPPRALAPPTAVRQELGRFVSAGLLAQYQPDGENRVYYEMTDSPLWDIIRTARDTLVGSPRLSSDLP